jgi:hypothetical protein
MGAKGPFIEPGIKIVQGNEEEQITLSFVGSTGELREVILYRSNPPIVLAAVQKEIALARTAPIDRGSFQSGNEYKIQSFAIRKQPDASARLTLQVKLPDRRKTLTIALPLSQKDVGDLTRRLRNTLPNG